MNVCLSLPGSQRTATCNLRQSLYFLPRRSLKSPADYVCVHLEVREGPVSVLAQRASRRERSWQRLSSVALLDFRAALCIHV